MVLIHNLYREQQNLDFLKGGFTMWGWWGFPWFGFGFPWFGFGWRRWWW